MKKLILAIAIGCCLTVTTCCGQAIVSPQTIPATSFPDGNSSTYSTADGALQFSTSNLFNVPNDWVADTGGNANAFDGNEELTVEFDQNAALLSFTNRFTRTDLIISGLDEDPQASVGTANSNSGTAIWNAQTNLLTLDIPWDAGENRTVTFANPVAFTGKTVTFSFTDVQADWQATFVEFTYGFTTPGPIVSLSLDSADISGQTILDQSGSGNDANIVESAFGPLIDVDGIFGEAMQFVAGDDPAGIVKLESGVVPSGDDARTISLWFNQLADAGQNKLFGYGSISAGAAFDVGIEGGGIRLRHFGGNITYGTGFDFTGSDAGWHHLAVVVAEGSQIFADVSVYLDGQQLAAQLGGAEAVVINTGVSEFAIGSSSIASSAFGLDGLIDEVRIWDAELSAASIAIEAQFPPSVRINRFHANPQNRVPMGTNVTLAWDVENFQSLTLNPGGLDVTNQPSFEVTVVEKTTFELVATDEVGNTESKDVTIAIGDQPYPNIVVIFLDDFGWADWEQNGGSTGSVFYETPNMNRLAEEGMYFPRGYAASPVCSPTRASLMTGQSPAFNKVTQWIPGGGDNGQPIQEAVWSNRLETGNSVFPEVLSDCGYRSTHIGKWHLGDANQTEAEPLSHGFDLNIGGNHFGTPPGPERYFASADGFSGLPGLGSDIAPQGAYLTDVLTQQAVQQISQAASEDSAFMIYLSHYAVHTPIQAPASTVQYYQNKISSNPGMNWQGQTNPAYAAMIDHVDQSVGAILDALEDPNGDGDTSDSVAENTLIVLTADNGGLTSVTSNRPLRDGKGGNYEGGIREPWIFHWPGKIAPGTNNELIVSHDLYPTLLSVAGLDKPEGHTVNGQDLSPLLFGTEPFAREQPSVFHYPHWSPQGGSPHSAIMIDNFKLIYEYASASWELYDLDADIGESQNLTQLMPIEHALYSYLLSDTLLDLGANYPRNNSMSAEEPPMPLFLPGDLNLDGTVNLLDVAPFVDRVSGSVYQVEGDLNFDGNLNLLDVEPFVTILGGG